LEKLAALTPRPRINLVLYHGVLAPHARWRGRVVAHARAEAGASAQADAAAPDRVEGSPDPAPEARIGARRQPADAAERPGPNGGCRRLPIHVAVVRVVSAALILKLEG